MKGEDLLFLDQENAKLRDEDRAAYAKLGLPTEPFSSTQLLAPVRKGSTERLPAIGSRAEGVQAFFWTIREVVTERLLRFLFAEAEDGGASQLSFVVDKIEAKLAAAAAAKGDAKDPWIEVEGRRVETFDAPGGGAHRPPRRATRAWPTVGAAGGGGNGGRLRAAAPRGREARRPPRSGARTWASATPTCSTGGESS